MISTPLSVSHQPELADPLDTLTRMSRARGAEGQHVQIVFRHGDKQVELQCRLLSEQDGESIGADSGTVSGSDCPIRHSPRSVDV